MGCNSTWAGSGRVERGGTWPDGAGYIRTVNRYGYNPSYTSDSLGLPLACEDRGLGPRKSGRQFTFCLLSWFSSFSFLKNK